MYESFYHLASLPFENTPDPKFFFASEPHREALAAIEYTIRMRKGFVVVTGGVGTGKTTVGQAMRARCGNKADIVAVTYGHTRRDGLLRQVLRALKIEHDPADDHAVLVERAEQYLLEQIGVDRPVVLFVDEAQTLADEALEELRLLTNLDTATSRLIQIVLVGQPELRPRLNAPQHAALRQRIVMAKQIHPLGLEETAAYIRHRLGAAALDPESARGTFNAAAIQAVYHSTGGIPRLINITCDNCLLMGYVREQRVVTDSTVNKVTLEMMPNFEITEDSAPQSRPALALAGGA
ncbi:MAG: hypothetical protein CMJ18_20670 [Phycisphaeraceae bacterium]|nr:hypothetical protein [Phycisphaeraceae bacterium]